MGSTWTSSTVTPESRLEMCSFIPVSSDLALAGSGAAAALGFSGGRNPGQEGCRAHAAYLGSDRWVGRGASGVRAAGRPRRGRGVGLGSGLRLLDEVVQGHV